MEQKVKIYLRKVAKVMGMTTKTRLLTGEMKAVSVFPSICSLTHGSSPCATKFRQVKLNKKMEKEN